jgi:predicted acylesterase/phospholipase RssA
MFLCWRGSQNVRAKTFMEREVAERYEEPALSAFGAALKQMFLPGGQVLLRENEVADSLYIAISGCLGVVIRDSNDRAGLVARIGAGETDVHVDGGVMNWLPVDVPCAKRGAIIAVDVASDPALVSFEECNRVQAWRFLGRRRKFPPIVAVLLRGATVSGDSLTKTAYAHADILFKPPLDNVDLLDWQTCDQAIEAGYRHFPDLFHQLVMKKLSEVTHQVSPRQE